MKRRNLIDIIERFQTQHALQEEREMKLNPTEPLVANLSRSLREGAELKGRPQPTEAKKKQQ